MINMKLPKYLTKNKDNDYILTDKTGKRWVIARINMIIDEFEEQEKEKAAKKEEKFDNNDIHPRKRLEILRQIIK